MLLCPARHARDRNYEYNSTHSYTFCLHRKAGRSRIFYALHPKFLFLDLYRVGNGVSMGLMNKVRNGVNEAGAPKENSFSYLGPVVEKPINANPHAD